MSEWLYEDGADADEKTLKGKHGDLKALINPIVSRKEETRNRPELVKKLQQALEQTQSMAKVMQDSVDKAAEASSSAAAASSASASASSSSAAAAEASGEATPAAEADPFADLEEDDEAPSASSAAEDAQPTEPSFVSPYTQADLDDLTKALDETTKWLDGKLAAQGALKETDDPALSGEELEGKTKALNDVTLELITRKIRMPAAGGKKSSGGKKTGGKKGAKDSKAKGKKEKEEAKAKAKAEEEKPVAGDEGAAGEEKQSPEHSEL